jgi:hypothetical protein
VHAENIVEQVHSTSASAQAAAGPEPRSNRRSLCTARAIALELDDQLRAGPIERRVDVNVVKVVGVALRLGAKEGDANQIAFALNDFLRQSRRRALDRRRQRHLAVGSAAPTSIRAHRSEKSTHRAHPAPRRPPPAELLRDPVAAASSSSPPRNPHSLPPASPPDHRCECVDSVGAPLMLELNRAHRTRHCSTTKSSMSADDVAELEFTSESALLASLRSLLNESARHCCA